MYLHMLLSEKHITFVKITSNNIFFTYQPLKFSCIILILYIYIYTNEVPHAYNKIIILLSPAETKPNQEIQ